MLSTPSTNPSNLTHASSTSTTGVGEKTVRIKSAPAETYNWSEWFNLTNGQIQYQYPNNPSGYYQQPSYQQPSTTPSQPSYQQPAASPATPSQSGDSSQFAQQVLNLVNQERSKAGLSALSMSSALNNVAMTKAQDMYNNNYFDHQSPTYGSPFDMMKSFGVTYSAAGENIAKGQTSPQEVMNSWMNSPGHRANILNSSFTQIGIAYYNSEWVQEFTG
ncbi:CAP domain-containing protein [Paenibacillus cremeus]|nr:CAP domain-containing protein [Paenibacillus cremeus]